jgi:LysR family glycine cleavage system transcriptional activator
MRTLPNLNALRAFEAASRLGSFKGAAEDLHVTHAAISRHIRMLEEELGTTLFLRLHRKVVLTPAGEGYSRAIRGAFDAIGRATQLLAHKSAPRRLSLHCEPGFANRWLIRRLHKFRDRYPEIEVDIVSATRLAELPDPRIDAIIHYGRPKQKDLRQDHMMSLRAFPLCSPGMLTGPEALRLPEDLKRFRLLHQMTPAWWTSWLDAAGVSGVPVENGPVYHEYSLILDAAIAGEGIIIGDDLLAYDDILAGRLVMPFTLTQPAESYYFVCHQSRADDPIVTVFRTWLLDECRHQAEASAALSRPALS